MIRPCMQWLLNSIHCGLQGNSGSSDGVMHRAALFGVRLWRPVPVAGGRRAQTALLMSACIVFAQSEPGKRDGTTVSCRAGWEQTGQGSTVIFKQRVFGRGLRRRLDAPHPRLPSPRAPPGMFSGNVRDPRLCAARRENTGEAQGGLGSTNIVQPVSQQSRGYWTCLRRSTKFRARGVFGCRTLMSCVRKKNRVAGSMAYAHALLSYGLGMNGL